jgi:hypothetical protein
MSVTSLLCLTVLSPIVLPEAQAGRRANRFAAIAYSPLTGRYGYATGAGCLADADVLALANCRAPDAQIWAWVENGWVALARSREGLFVTYGVSTRSLAEAEAIALRGCAQTGCPGVILAWAASR